MKSQDPIFSLLCPAFISAACLFASPGLFAKEHSVTMPSEEEGWEMTIEDANLSLFAEGFFASRYAFQWSPDDEDMEWLNSESITFDFIELEVGLSFFDGALDAAVEIETGLEGIGLLEGWLQWNVVEDIFSIQAGRLKTPFSKDFHRENHTLRFLDRPLSEDVFGIHNDFGVAIEWSFRDLNLVETSDFSIGLPIKFHSGLFAGTQRTLESHVFGEPLTDLSANSPLMEEELPLPPNPYVVNRFIVGLFPRFGWMDDFGLKTENTFVELGASMKQNLEPNTQLPTQAYGADLTLNAGNLTVMAEGLAEYAFDHAGSTNAISLEHAGSKYGVWFETRYRLFQRFEPAFRLIGQLAPEDESDDSMLHSHQAMLGFAVYFMDDLLRWQVDVGADQDEWDFENTRFMGQTALSARF